MQNGTEGDGRVNEVSVIHVVCTLANINILHKIVHLREAKTELLDNFMYIVPTMLGTVLNNTTRNMVEYKFDTRVERLSGSSFGIVPEVINLKHWTCQNTIYFFISCVGKMFL